MINNEYHYNHGIEVDFVIPEDETAVQVCYSMNDLNGTFERETNAIVKLQDKIKTKRKIIVTFEDEGTIEKDSLKIEVIPSWKFILKKLKTSCL